ncbi:hypothetical protein J6590_094069 [Homalodisca vitripennis]|nr:hypothetical protein J6590_094069 [Homalodisca vitripennis]
MEFRTRELTATPGHSAKLPKLGDLLAPLPKIKTISLSLGTPTSTRATDSRQPSCYPVPTTSERGGRSQGPPPRDLGPPRHRPQATPPSKTSLKFGGHIPDMTFTNKTLGEDKDMAMTIPNKDMAMANKDLTVGSPSRLRSGSGRRAENKELTYDLTPTRIATERMVMGTTDGTDDDSEGYAVVTKKRKNRSSLTTDARKSKKDKIEASRFRLDMGTDEDTDESDKEDSATSGMTNYDAVVNSINLVLVKLRLLQKKSGSSDKIRDIEKELHSTLRCARSIHEENLTLRARLEERTSILKIFKEAIPPTQPTTASNPGSSYAQAAARQVPQHRTIPPRPPKPTQTILVYPKTERATFEEVKDMVRRTVDLKALGLRVHRMTKIRNGGVAIEIEGQEQAKKLAETLQPVVNTRGPKKRLPKILVYDVPRVMEPNELVRDVFEQNIRSTGMEPKSPSSGRAQEAPRLVTGSAKSALKGEQCRHLCLDSMFALRATTGKLCVVSLCEFLVRKRFIMVFSVSELLLFVFPIRLEKPKPTKNEHAVYRECVANRVRKIQNPMGLCIVKNKIDNIHFEAEMEEYKDVSEKHEQTKHLNNQELFRNQWKRKTSEIFLH